MEVGPGGSVASALGPRGSLARVQELERQLQVERMRNSSQAAQLHALQVENSRLRHASLALSLLVHRVCVFGGFAI